MAVIDNFHNHHSYLSSTYSIRNGSQALRSGHGHLHPTGRKQGPIPDPNDLKKTALFEQAVNIETSNFDHGASSLAYEKNFKKRVVESRLEGYEAVLSKQKYMAGDEYSLVDIFHLSYGSLLKDMDFDYLESEKYPTIARWWKDISNRPAWKKVNMSPEERQALLHEGVSTTQTLSAFVEIVFDNSDNRFPTGRDEVILRRTIGLKKDEYSLDKKSASKANIINLLESAGFSKSNPYYVVPQGRITALTSAKDHELLALLKEVAGTKVYEQRRAEPLRIMAETDSKRAKIGELLDYIDTWLTELEEEKEELKEFQDKDKERRCLEYVMHQRDLEEVGAALEEIEEERRGELHSTNIRREQYTDREKQVQNLSNAEIRTNVTTLNFTRQGTQSELTDLIRSRAELECTIADLQLAAQRAGGRRNALEEELAAVEDAITAKEQELANIIPEWDRVRGEENAEGRHLDEARARPEALYAKRGCLDKFWTKAERDRYLRAEIASMQQFRTGQADALVGLEQELARAKQSLAEVNSSINATQAKAEDARKQTDETERRKELWREDAKLESLVTNAADELRGAERTLASMMDKNTGNGLRSIDRIVASNGNFDGVYGPLNNLFHVVVDRDETASRLVDIMMREKNGRVTFMPLNRLKAKVPPAPNAQDAIPLMDKLRFDTKHSKAFQQVFGKICVCRDLTIAAVYVKSHGINTITLDGDKVNRKGALTGGYHDVRRSRIEAIRNVSTWRTAHTEHTARLREVKATIATLEQEITKGAGELQTHTARQGQARVVRESVAEEVAVLLREKERHATRTARLEGDIEELRSELSGLDAKI
ncbi:hypothetical protein GSI_04106 [Ganoderma sinense ZZ0214-1]|uniref:GST C-terminal domain-containing protein n=1 Tax=Ganoderma sinense ZZ0214-1 TaxID=1077348 RepID=A0A2G8SI94_9APHY|nr:hypothetical protein GSI_04106 [Ganoderma sinense ZZ0214-1]